MAQRSMIQRGSEHPPQSAGWCGSCVYNECFSEEWMILFKAATGIWDIVCVLFICGMMWLSVENVQAKCQLL